MSTSWLPLAVGSVVLAAIGQFLWKLGARGLGPGFSLIAVALNPMVWAGLALFGISSVLWINVLHRAALSVVYPIGSLSYLIIMFLSWHYLHEPMSALKVAGVLTIMLGIGLIGLG